MLTNKGFVRLDPLVHTLLLLTLVVLLLPLLFPLSSEMFDENLKVLLHRLDERNTSLFGRSLSAVVLPSRSLQKPLGCRCFFELCWRHVHSSASTMLPRWKWERERDKRRFLCTLSRIERVDPETSFSRRTLEDTVTCSYHVYVTTVLGGQCALGLGLKLGEVRSDCRTVVGTIRVNVIGES